MLAVPYSRYIFGSIPWYSFLIVTGASIAIILASREEKRTGLKKDTVLDFALIVLPVGIIGARLYYVLFSWNDFRNDILSVFKIWEGGIAIYGAIIAGLITAVVFCRKRKISFLILCDIIAPGLVLAQAIGRWGNYFNQEAYGLALHDPSLCFFPFAVLIQSASGTEWHMATFFYEFVWNMLVFIFLMISRRKWFRYHGDVISFYALLYACGRLVIEDFRMDSLYASSTIRISQLLSVLICIIILVRYIRKFTGCRTRFSPVSLVFSAASLIYDLLMILWMTNLVPWNAPSVLYRFIVLMICCILNISALMLLYSNCADGVVVYADNKV